MTDATDTFRQGAGALRNARDWAKEKREELITALLPRTKSAVKFRLKARFVDFLWSALLDSL